MHSPGFARLPSLTAAFAALMTALYLVAPLPADGVERLYARGLYARLADVVVPLTNALPFSLAAVLLVLLLLGWLVTVAALARRRAWARALWFTLGLAALLAGWFVVMWGLNYRRSSVEAQFGLVQERDTPGDTATDAERDTEALLAYLQAVVQANIDAERNEVRAQAALAVALQELVARATGVVPTLPARPKLLPPGLLIRFGGASGVMSPWTLEPHVDGALSEVGRLAVGLHELAHVAGYAGEADADFVAKLAGLRAEDGYARYAVALYALSGALPQLPAADRARWTARLPARARADLDALYAPFRRYAPPAWWREVQRRAFDAYLRSQGVAAGVADYDRATLLLAAALRQGWLPEA